MSLFIYKVNYHYSFRFTFKSLSLSGPQKSLIPSNRGNGIGFAAMAARIGGVLAPYIISLQDEVTWLPNAIFGVFAVSGGLLSLTLRDTTGHPMMETIEEAEIFYAGKNVQK